MRPAFSHAEIAALYVTTFGQMPASLTAANSAMERAKSPPIRSRDVVSFRTSSAGHPSSAYVAIAAAFERGSPTWDDASTPPSAGSGRFGSGIVLRLNPAFDALPSTDQRLAASGASASLEARTARLPSGRGSDVCPEAGCCCMSGASGAWRTR